MNHEYICILKIQILIFLLQAYIIPFPQVRVICLSLIKHKPFIPLIPCIEGHLPCVFYVYEVATRWARQAYNLKYDACPFPSDLTVVYNHPLYTASAISFQVEPI